MCDTGIDVNYGDRYMSQIQDSLDIFFLPRFELELIYWLREIHKARKNLIIAKRRRAILFREISF